MWILTTDDAAVDPPVVIRLATGAERTVGRANRSDFILDAALQRIAEPRSLAGRLVAIPGVVEHGLFIGLARTAVIAGPDGLRVVERPTTGP